MAPMYYRGAQAAIVVFDITNADTFARAKTWVKELQVGLPARMYIVTRAETGQPQYCHCPCWKQS